MSFYFMNFSDVINMSSIVTFRGGPAPLCTSNSRFVPHESSPNTIKEFHFCYDGLHTYRRRTLAIVASPSSHYLVPHIQFVLNFPVQLRYISSGCVFIQIRQGHFPGYIVFQYSEFISSNTVSCTKFTGRCRA